MAAKAKNEIGDEFEHVATAFASAEDGKDPERLDFYADGSQVKVVASAEHLTYSAQDFLAVLRAASKIGGSL